MMLCCSLQWRKANRQASPMSNQGKKRICIAVILSRIYSVVLAVCMIFHVICRSLAVAVQKLACNVSADFFTMVVRRSHLLEDALNRTRSKHFSPSKTIYVSLEV